MPFNKDISGKFLLLLAQGNFWGLDKGVESFDSSWLHFHGTQHFLKHGS